MTMLGKVFQNGKNQAILTPNKYRIDAEEVDNTLIIKSKDKDKWDILFDTLEDLTEDFLEDRNQPPAQEREDLF